MKDLKTIIRLIVGYLILLIIVVYLTPLLLNMNEKYKTEDSEVETSIEDTEIDLSTKTMLCRSKIKAIDYVLNVNDEEFKFSATIASFTENEYLVIYNVNDEEKIKVSKSGCLIWEKKNNTQVYQSNWYIEEEK